MEKGEKMGQRRGLAQGKCPPVRESREGAAWRKGRKGVRGEGRPKKMPAGRGSHKRIRRGERGEKGSEERAGPRKMPAGEGVTRGAGVEKGRKGARGEGQSKENARR